MSHTVLGWAFQSQLQLAAMKQRLDAAWDTPWVEGDSAWYGDYLGGRLSPEAVARIYEVDNKFIVNLRFYSKHSHANAQLERAKHRLLTEVLPLLEAQGVVPCDPLD